ncbi:MAG: hypothetical protein ACP5I7_00915 [Sulfolobales archaeon]|jgi:rRNA-processing protein FCF1
MSSSGSRYVIIDTSVFLLIRDKYDVLTSLREDLEEYLECATTDSVVRELISTAIRSGEQLLLEYLKRIFEKCMIFTLSEDLEREEADHDLLLVAKILNAPLLTLDKELKREARRERIRMIIYRGPDKRIISP